MRVSVRRCSSYDSDDLTLNGFEVIVELGPFGLQMFVGWRR